MRLRFDRYFFHHRGNANDNENMRTWTEIIELTDKKMSQLQVKLKVKLVKLCNFFLSVSFSVSVQVRISSLNMRGIIIYVAR